MARKSLKERAVDSALAYALAQTGERPGCTRMYSC